MILCLPMLSSGLYLYYYLNCKNCTSKKIKQMQINKLINGKKIGAKNIVTRMEQACTRRKDSVRIILM